MDIIQATHLLEKVHNNDVGQLLNWVFYHDSLSSFTMHHWRHKSLAPYATDSNHLHSQDFQTRASLTRQRPVRLRRQQQQTHGKVSVSSANINIGCRQYNVPTLQTQY